MLGAMIVATVLIPIALQATVLATRGRRLSRRQRRPAQIAHQHSSVTQWVTHITSVASARDISTSREVVYSKSQRTRRAPSKCRRSSVPLKQEVWRRPYSKHLRFPSTATSLPSSTTKFSSTAKQVATLSRVHQLLVGNWRQRVANLASPPSASVRRGKVRGQGST